MSNARLRAGRRTQVSRPPTDTPSTENPPGRAKAPVEGRATLSGEFGEASDDAMARSATSGRGRATRPAWRRAEASASNMSGSGHSHCVASPKMCTLLRLNTYNS